MVVMIILLYAGPAMFGIQYNMFNTPNSIKVENVPNLDGAHTNKPLHHTLLFNTFMMMQLFNQLNCRKLQANELNVFERIFNNPLFIIILGAEFAMQWFIVDVGVLVPMA
jgi:magnesium-transporting ATPase (P-type)